MQYKCGAYLRLSDADDNRTDDSSSIKSQKLIIESFANFNKLNIHKTYTDDGFSGGNFDRPAFKEMINDIESGVIDCVITKDLSRLGREMYGTGNYIEQYFREKNIRYIAINDSYDSLIGDSMLGIRLSVNDLYLRDVSKKVKTSMYAKKVKGEYIGSIPLYGYLKDPNDHHKLIVDEGVRDNIEYIYSLALEGYSPTKIAELFTRKHIPIPVIYKNEIRGKEVTENDGYGIWKRQTIKNILTNQMYIGNMVQNKFAKVSYNSKKLKRMNEEEYIIVENTHEAIINKDDYNKVQKLLNSRSCEKRTAKQFQYLLGGMLYCKDCGRTIRIGEKIIKSMTKHYTQCNLYTRKGKFGVCSSHCVDYDALEEDIIEYLCDLCKDFCSRYEISDIEDNSSIIIEKNLKILKEKQDKYKNIVINHKNTLDNLYIDKVNGVIDERMFKRIYDKTNVELQRYEEDIKNLQSKIELNEINNDKGNSFKACKKAVLDYMTLSKPNKKQIENLIDRIEIDNDKNIDIYLKFKNLTV